MRVMAKFFTLTKSIGETHLYPVSFDERLSKEHGQSLVRNIAYPLQPIPDWIPADSSLEHIAKFFIDGRFVEPDQHSLINWSA
jgi:hypothetical protein